MDDYQEHVQWAKPDTQESTYCTYTFKSIYCILTLLKSLKQAKQIYGGTI